MIFKQNANSFSGVEIAIFRLKDNASEQDVITLSNKIDEEFLSQFDDLYAHFLLKGADGLYADVVLASSQQKAEEICALWNDNELTTKYIEKIDPESVNMSFWTKIS